MEFEIDKMYLLALGVILLFTLIASELLWPARNHEKQKKKVSYLTNTLIFAFNNIILFSLQVTTVYLLAYQYSFLNVLVTLPIALQIVLGILILDFSIWYWHLLNHKIPLFWRFHKCHHSETYLNAASAVRFHIGELLFSVLFKSLVIIALGVPFWIFILYESLITLFAMFHHANINIPQRIQQKIDLLFVTPNMHRTHHSSVRKEHDSNYGVIFSFWDKLLKTYKTVQPRVIGLDHVEEKNFLKFLVFPIRKK